MSEQEEKSDFEKRREEFRVATCWEKASSVVWRECFGHPYYQHYTTLDRVVSKIVNQEWWLTRSDSVRLNDKQETEKFGKIELAKRTYQASFVQGVRESAAMWGLYAREDPLAIRILIPRDAMKKWIGSLKLADDPKKCGNVQLTAANPAEFKDVIYASVPLVNHKRDSLDKQRGDCVYWAGMRNDFGKNKDIQKSFLEGLHIDAVTGWLKDSEWQHECESRLCVRIRKTSGRTALPVCLPAGVIAKMSFTLSPWLDKEHEGEVENVLKALLEQNAKGLECKPNSKPFRRSTLQGALNFK